LSGSKRIIFQNRGGLAENSDEEKAKRWEARADHGGGELQNRPNNSIDIIPYEY
jgi:hypothetical protein